MASNNGSAGQPLVSITFNIRGKETHDIAVHNAPAADLNFVDHEKIAAAPGGSSYAFSGKHDHGDLPKMKSEGYEAEVISALIDAKAQCDAYLTQCISLDNGNKPEKKAKIEGDEGDGAMAEES